ncbi:MAG: hotdog fold domain-containing protein, partial [Sedimenticolaceae bacterium]
RFRKPVFPGDAIDVEIEVTKTRGPLVEVDVTMKDGAGNVISTAKSRLLAPDDAYREWWLKQS